MRRLESEIMEPAWLGEGPHRFLPVSSHGRSDWGALGWGKYSVRTNPTHEDEALMTCSPSRGFPCQHPSHGLEDSNTQILRGLGHSDQSRIRCTTLLICCSNCYTLTIGSSSRRSLYLFDRLQSVGYLFVFADHLFTFWRIWRSDRTFKHKEERVVFSEMVLGTCTSAEWSEIVF